MGGGSACWSDELRSLVRIVARIVVLAGRSRFGVGLRASVCRCRRFRYLALSMLVVWCLVLVGLGFVVVGWVSVHCCVCFVLPMVC